MKFLNWFRKKEKALEPEKKEEPIVPSQLDRIESNTTFIKDNMARELTVQELIQALAKRFQALPISKTLKDDLRENHKRILAVLTQDQEAYYSYEELATATALTSNGVRGLVSEMQKFGIRFDKKLDGRKARIKLIPSIPSAPSALDK